MFGVNFFDSLLKYVGAQSFISGSSLVIEIDPTTADLIDIDGTLAISSGTTLDVRVLPGLYSPPDKYLAIQTTGGISGRFTYELISYPSLTYKLTTLMITSTLL